MNGLTSMCVIPSQKSPMSCWIKHTFRLFCCFQAEDFVEASGRISLLPEELPSARFAFYTNHLETAYVLSHSFVTGIFSYELYVQSLLNVVRVTSIVIFSSLFVLLSCDNLQKQF